MIGRQLVLATATMTLAVGLVAPAAATEVNFEGKTIRLVTSSLAGGPTDLLARQFAPFIASHIPGHPTIIIENRGGAGGMLGANYLFNNAKPDGLTMGFLIGTSTQGLIGGSNVRFDPAKFRWLGALSTTHVILARNDLAMSTPRDLLMPAKPLILASSSPVNTATIANRLFLDMVGAKYTIVSGYVGQANSILALARGEVNLDTIGLSAYQANRETFRQEGIFQPLVQRGEFNSNGSFSRNKLIPDIPTMIEAIESIRPEAAQSAEFAANRAIVGTFAIHQGLALPPGTDAATVSSLRTSVANAFNDPEMRKALKAKLKFEYDFFNGEDCERIIAQLQSSFRDDARIVPTILDLMKRK